MTAASTDDLIIRMSVDMDQLRRDLERVRRDLDDVGDSGENAGRDVDSGMDRAGKAAKGFAVAITAAATAGAAALGGLYAHILDTTAELNRFAASTGIAAEDLQYYAAGAKMLGVEQADLGDIFKDVQDKIGDFLTTGAGGMVDFFEQVAPLVGLTAEEFRHLGGADALLLVMESMEKVGLSANDIVFQMEAIASESSRLIPLLKDGGAGFKLFGDEAKRSGAIMSDELVEAATTSSVQLNLLKNELLGLGNDVFETTAPALEFLAEKTIGLSKVVRSGEIQAALGGILGAFNIFGDGAVDSLADVASGFADLVFESATAKATIEDFNTIGNVVQMVGRSYKGLGIIVGETVQTIRGEGNMDLAGEALEELDNNTNARIDSIKKGLAEYSRLRAERLKQQAADDADRAKRQDAMTALLTGGSGKGGTGGMRTTQAERDKQAAADKAAGDRAKAAAEAAARELEQQKKTAQDFLQAISDQAKSEAELRQVGYDRQIQQANAYYDQGLIDAAEYGQAIAQINRAEAEENAKIADDEWTKQIELAAAAGAAEAELHDAQMAAQIERANELKDLNEQQRLLTDEGKLAAINEQFLAQQELVAELFEQGIISEDERQARLLALDAVYNQKRLDATKEYFDGQRELGAAFQSSQLQGALNFFAQDFGGFSKHSRKMFEITKAARLAEAALAIPATVMGAVRAGNSIGGPVVGAAYGAAALATQLGNLRQIQAAQFGGGGGGGSGGGGSGGTVPAAQEQQQPQIERFVNLSIIGESNDITSIGNVRNLIERINSEIQNGAVLRVN